MFKQLQTNSTVRVKAKLFHLPPNPPKKKESPHHAFIQCLNTGCFKYVNNAGLRIGLKPYWEFDP